MATPAPPSTSRWRDRVLPKSVLGITALILAAAIGAAFSGAVFYAYYDYRLGKNEKFVAQFQKRYADATKAIDAEREDAKAQIRKELEPLTKLAAEGNTLDALVQKVSASVWFVRTSDDAGAPSVGSAFVVASDGDQTLLLTSYATVKAATRSPGPAVTVKHGNDPEIKATLWTWQEDKDLALLILNKADVPRLSWASGSAKTGDRIFAVSGLGAGGGAIAQGFVADVSSAGIQHDVAVGQSFQGGPLVNDKGEVVAVASRAYAPLNFTTDDIFFGVPVRDACDRVLRCPSGQNPGAGSRG